MNERPLVEALARIPPFADAEATEKIPQNSDDARKEALGFANKSLDQIAEENEHCRNEVLRNHVHIASIFLVWVVCFLFVSIGSILAIHICTPWHWLTDDQQTTLKALFFSGAVTTADAYVDVSGDHNI